MSLSIYQLSEAIREHVSRLNDEPDDPDRDRFARIKNSLGDSAVPLQKRRDPSWPHWMRRPDHWLDRDRFMDFGGYRREIVTILDHAWPQLDVSDTDYVKALSGYVAAGKRES